MTTGEKIRYLRKQKNLTQKEVAARCGMADSAIRKYESGKITPKLDTIQRIADALEVSPNALLDFNTPSETQRDPSTYHAAEFNDFSLFIESMGYYIRVDGDHYRIHKDDQSFPITTEELIKLIRESKATAFDLINNFIETTK